MCALMTEMMNVKKTTLLVMAAGLGSRYGGIKQLEPISSNGEILMDYSIHDAVKAGFDRIVIVLRREIENDFRSVIGKRLEKVLDKAGIEVCYAFQDPLDIPGTFPNGRLKPWGTGQAVLSAKGLLDAPFAVINADDYYGREAYRKMHAWLIEDHAEEEIAMAGFILKNTLSENGGVTRGVCRVSDDGTSVLEVRETHDIRRTSDGIRAGAELLDPNAYVSMNMWGFPGNPPYFLRVLSEGFAAFFEEKVPNDPLKAEYLLPVLIGERLKENKCTVSVLQTRDKWFGVTYKEDKEAVIEAIRACVRAGVYTDDLYADLTDHK